MLSRVPPSGHLKARRRRVTPPTPPAHTIQDAGPLPRGKPDALNHITGPEAALYDALPAADGQWLEEEVMERAVVSSPPISAGRP